MCGLWLVACCAVCRGRKPQGRTLRRMVEAGFVDLRTAMAAMREPLVLGSDTKVGTSGPWRAPYFVSEVRAQAPGAWVLVFRMLG